VIAGAELDYVLLAVRDLDEASAASTPFGRWVLARRTSPLAPLGWAVRTSSLDEHAARLGLCARGGGWSSCAPSRARSS